MPKLRDVRYLKSRAHGWYYERFAPKDLQPVVGKKHWTIPLKVGSKAEATKAVRRLASLHDEKIEQLRGIDADASSRVELLLDDYGNPVEARKRVAARPTEVATFYDRARQAMEAEAEKSGTPLRVALYNLKLLDAVGGRAIDVATEDTEADLAALEAVDGRKTTPSAGDGLGYIFAIWCKRANPTDLSVGEADLAMRRFIAVNGDLPLGKITKDHVRTFRGVLEKLPKRIPNKQRDLSVDKIAEKTPQDGTVALLSSATVRKQIGFVRTLLGVAENDGLIDSNPAGGIRIVDDRDEKARYPFDEAHLRAIFGALPTNDPTFYWMTTLAYMTGARMSEIAGLSAANVRTEDGVTFLDVVDGKTVNARRRIPVHPDLVNLGFLDYVATRPGALTDHRPDTKGRLTGYFQKRFGRFLRTKAKVIDPRVTFHSFRHGFRDLALSSGVDEVLIERLQGWAPATAGRGYGRGASLQRLADAVASIKFPARPNIVIE